MSSGPDSAFALPELDALLREELACVPAHAARQPAGRALLVQACGANRRLPVDVRHLAATRVHLEGGVLRGDLACTVDALPWEDDAFRLVFLQHVGEMLPTDTGLIDELARVLAPGGMLVWSGLSPWSPWRAWMSWQVRGSVSAPRVLHVVASRRQLLARGLAVAGVEHVGGCWPPHHVRTVLPRWLGPLRGAWLLLGAKQQAALTPLRPRNLRERVAIRPQLAVPSRRASA